jgi:hypothetical protein
MALKDLRASVRGTLRLRQWCCSQHSKQTCRQSLAVADGGKRQFALILRSRSTALRSLVSPSNTRQCAISCKQRLIRRYAHQPQRLTDESASAEGLAGGGASVRRADLMQLTSDRDAQSCAAGNALKLPLSGARHRPRRAMLLTCTRQQDIVRTVQCRCRAHIVLRSEMCACGLENPDGCHSTADAQAPHNAPSEEE